MYRQSILSAALKQEIATVNAAGKIKAKAPGSCNVYVYAINGVSETVKVTVKAKKAK